MKLAYLLILLVFIPSINLASENKQKHHSTITNPFRCQINLINKEHLISLPPNKNLKYQYNDKDSPNIDFTFGQLTNIPNKLDLPMPVNGKAEISLAHNKRTHTGNMRYSVDFALPIGTPIKAVKSGYVIKIVDGFDEGKPAPIYRDKANFIGICHEDGTIANYGHLLKNTIKFKINDYVNAGDIIALSGNSGRSGGPHLHLDIRHPIDDKSYMTIPFTINGEEPKIGLVLGEGLSFTEKTKNAWIRKFGEE